MPAAPRIYFQTKVLIPMVLVMAFLLGVLMWVVSRRFTQQFSAAANKDLFTALDSFEYGEKNRLTNRVMQYRTVANELRAKTMVTQVLGSEIDDNTKQQTFEHFLSELLDELNANLGIFT